MMKRSGTQFDKELWRDGDGFILKGFLHEDLKRKVIGDAKTN
jgi:hypothetical protein